MNTTLRALFGFGSGSGEEDRSTSDDSGTMSSSSFSTIRSTTIAGSDFFDRVRVDSLTELFVWLYCGFFACQPSESIVDLSLFQLLESLAQTLVVNQETGSTARHRHSSQPKSREPNHTKKLIYSVQKFKTIFSKINI